MFQQPENTPSPSRRNDDMDPCLQLTFDDVESCLDAQQAFTLGSDTDCDLRIDGADVDGQHAEIYSVGTTWWVRDLGTEVGTFLNGEIVDAAPLVRPSEVQLGADGPTVHVA